MGISVDVAQFIDEQPPVRLSVGYDGPALMAGRMDVRTLASAMASVAQLVEDATRLTYGADAGVRIEVSGDFRRGSFSYQIVATALAGITPDQVKDVLVWLGLLSAPTGLTVIGVLKLLRGRKVDRATREGNDVRLIVGNQSHVVNIQVAQLVLNSPIRANLEGVTQPLDEPGIEVLRTGESDQVPATEITKAERPSFLAPAPVAEALHDDESVTVLQLISPVFRIGNKWQFAYPGEAAFFAPILDRGFLTKLQRREVSFSYGDLVRVRLRTVVSRTDTGALSTAREIREVIQIIPPARQADLFSEPEAGQ